MSDTIALQNLDQSLRAVWRRSQRLHLSAGLLAFCRWSVALLLVSVLIDWLTDAPTAGRVVMLVVLLVMAFARTGWRDVQSI